MKSLRLHAVLLLGLIASSAPSLAAPSAEKIAALESQARRPTVTQVLEATEGSTQDENPFSFGEQAALGRNNGNSALRYPNTAQGFRTYVWTHLPRAIARLERIFPGATWAGLGRDANFLSDGLDAFYTSSGQSKRVVRIDISSGSFSPDQTLNVEYLASLGAPVDPDKAAKAYPWIVLDRTSYGGIAGRYSGTLQIIDLIYSEYRARGGDPALLVKKANVVSTNPANGDWQNGPYLTAFSGLDVDGFLHEQEVKAKELGRPEKVIAIDAPLSDTTEWHNTFGVLQRNAQGRVESSPGRVHGGANPQRVLWELYEMLKITRSPEFLAAVSREAREIGYEFPLKRVRKLRSCEGSLAAPAK